MVKIIGVSGSLRIGSYNTSLLKTVKELWPEDSELEIIDISTLPLFNQDFENNMPANVLELKKNVESADAVLFVTPEHNYSVPSALKNFIDWASRPRSNNSFEGKPAGIMSASIGMLGGARAQYHLRQMMVFLNMHPMNRPEFMMPLAQDKFDANGKLKDEITRTKVKEYITALMAWVEKFRKLNA